MGRRAWWMLLAAIAIGCGSSAPGPTTGGMGTDGPRGGTLVQLPDGEGAVEVLVEFGPQGPSASRVVAYFTTADGGAPIDPPPTDVRVTLLSEGEQSYPLAPDAGGEGKFASSPVAIDPDRVAGELTATVAGATVAVPFSSGR